MSRVARTVRLTVLVLAAVVIVAAVVFYVLTRTDLGAERATAYILDKIRANMRGELTVGDVRARRILAGATLVDARLIGPDGRPFVIADSVQLSYDWRSFLGGNIVFDRAHAFGATLTVEKLPGDTLWNYQHIFSDTVPGPAPERRGRLVLLDKVELSDTRFLLRRPWEPDRPVAPRDTARLNLEPLAGGTVEVWRFENVNAAFPRVVWESPVEDGQIFVVDRLAADVYVWERPIDVRDARGTVTVRDSIVAFDAPAVSLPDSRASVLGSAIISRPGNLYEIRIDSDRFALSDLQWIYPELPDEGGGEGIIWIRSQGPRRILWLAQNARLSMPGNEVAGSFGIVTGDTTYFANVDLRAEPLDIEALRQMLPEPLRLEGLHVGSAVVEGPM